MKTTVATQPERRAGGRIVTVALLGAVLAPAFASFAIQFSRGFAAPLQDDYGALLAFGTGYVRQSSWSGKAAWVLTAQFNEYKLLFAHAVVAADISMTGRLNFGFLNAFGDLFLLPIAWLLWLIYARKREEGQTLAERLAAFLPASFLFFALAYWEITDWAMASLSDFPVVYFAFFAIWLLAADGRRHVPASRVALACVSGSMAAFCVGNGFLLVPVGFAMLAQRRAFRASLAWTASFIPALLLYFYRYRHVAEPLSPIHSVTRPLEILTFLGSALQSLWPSISLGAAILTIGWFAARSRFDRKNPAAFYCAVWIVATCLLVAWVRGGGGVTYASRYSIYSVLMLVFCYFFLAGRFSAPGTQGRARAFRIGATALAIVFCAGSDAHAYRQLTARREMVLEGIEHYRANPAVNSPLIDSYVIKELPGLDATERIDLTEAIRSGIYSLPEAQALRR